MIKFILKVIVSAGLIWLLLRQTDVNALVEQIADLDPLPFAAAVLMIFGLAFPAALRWRGVLAALGHDIAFRPAATIVFIGLFFNQVLPSNVGGDAVRAWLIRRAGLATRRAVTSVVVDRILGLSVVFLMTALGLPWLIDLIAHPGMRAAFLVIAVGGIVGLVVLSQLDRLARHLPTWRVVRAIEALAVDFRSVISNRRIVEIAAHSIAVQVMFALSAFAIATGLGLSVNAWQCLVLIPPVVLAMAIPISVAGWGVREGAMVVTFGFIGVNSHDALAVSVLIGAATLLASLPGALVWLAAGRPQPETASDAEEPR